MKEYTGLMSVTDDVYGNQLRIAFSHGNTSTTIGNWAYRGVEAGRLVYWGESHDTWANDESGTSTSDLYSHWVSQNVVDRVYAITASRADATSLYFSRPTEKAKDSILAGVKGSTHFTSPEVAWANKFHNAFSGKTEYCSTSGNIYYVERGTKGVVFVNETGGSAAVSVASHKIANGTYTDQVSGTDFTVSGGIISGTIGSTGIAVVYNTDDVNEPEFSADKLYLVPGKWDKDGASFRACLYNSNTKVSAEIDMEASDEDGMYEAALPAASSWTKVKFQRISADGTEVWNYTDDYLPSAGNNCYTVNSTSAWTGDVGTWSSITVCDHNFTGPVWSWTSTIAANAVFTCSECSMNKTVAAEISRTDGETTITYTATAAFKGNTYTDTKTVLKSQYPTLYFDFSNKTGWANDSARFAVYSFNDDAGINAWTDMVRVSDYVYCVDLPDGDWEKMIFCRMNGAATENNWDNKWGQTVNLDIPADGNNCFVMNSEKITSGTDNGKYDGTWSTRYADGIGEKLAGYTLSLDGDIGVNFYMELDDSVASSSTAYMQFTIPTGNSTETQQLYVKDIISAGNTKVMGGKTYYIFKCRVSAKEMTSAIKARMYDGTGGRGLEYSYSVKEYADYLLSHTGDNAKYAEAAPLVKAMLNYGAYSQTYFGTNTDKPANEALTAAEKTLGDVTITHSDIVKTDLPEGVTLEGLTLTLRSETTLSLYFKNTSGNDVTFRLGESVITPVENGDYLQVKLTGINARKLSSDFTVSVGDTGSVICSPMNYCTIVLSGSYSDELKDTVKALYLYSQQADAYFADKA